MTFTDTTVVPHVVPVTTPILAIVRTTAGRATSAGFREGLVRASRFAAYCPRMLVAAACRREGLDELLAEASFYGIGVALGSVDAATVLLEPESLTGWQPTPAWWGFSEVVYQRWSSAPAARIEID